MCWLRRDSSWREELLTEGDPRLGGESGRELLWSTGKGGWDHHTEEREGTGWGRRGGETYVRGAGPRGGQQVKGKGHTKEWRGICYYKKTKKTLGV